VERGGLRPSRPRRRSSHSTSPPYPAPSYPDAPPSPYPTEHLHLPLLTRQPRSRTIAGRRPCLAHTVDACREFIMLDQRSWARDRGPGGLRCICIHTYTPPTPLQPSPILPDSPSSSHLHTPRGPHPFEGAMHPCLLLLPSLLADREWGVRRLSSLRKPPAGERGAS
jgi:hypothetical protein